MISRIKEKKEYLLAFLIPFFIVLLVFFTWGFFYKEGSVIYVSDLDGQYKPLLLYFKEHLFSEYSFSKGLGGSMVGTFAYYLASPFNLLVLFFSNENLHIATLLIILLKLSLSGLTMFTYLKHHFKKNKSLLLFSTCYVLMAYNVSYFFNIMWLDAVYLLPLVALGIDKLIEKKKSALYLLTLSFTIITNYYMGYMVCIFSVLYFLYRFFLQEKKDKNQVKKFIISSLLAGLLTSFLTIPTIFELTNSVRSTVNSFSELKILSPLKFLSGFFIGSHNSKDILSDGRYYIYIGTICFILILFYFINPKITKKEKKYSFIMLGIFIVSIFVNYVDTIWHVFSEPFFFSGRYMFIVCFFLLFLAAKSFDKIKEIKKEHYFYIAPIMPIFGILVFLGQFPYIKTYCVFITVFMFFIYLFLLYAYTMRKEYQNKILMFILLLTFAELFANMFFSTSDYIWIKKEAEKILYNTNVAEVQKLKKKNKNFFRMENSYGISLNDSFYFDYYGVQTFLSTLPKKQYQFFNDVGYTLHGNIIEYKRPFPVLDSLLGVKYVLHSIPAVGYEKIAEFKQPKSKGPLYQLYNLHVSVYENPNALSLGTVLSHPLNACQIKFQDYAYLEYQNQIVSCLYGKDVHIFEKVEMKKEGNQYFVKPKKNAIMYFYPEFRSGFIAEDEIIYLKLFDTNVGSFANSSFIIQEYTSKDDSMDELTFSITSKSGKDYQLYAYQLNFEEFEKVFQELKQNSLQIVENKNTYLKGKVKVTNENSYLFLTIPYDAGWTIYVDGKKTNYDEVFGSFMGLSLKKGEHTIEFKFVPEGKWIGITVSFITLILTIFYIKNERRDKRV